MRAVLAEGASMINDIEALCAPGALDAVADTDCAVCLMHKKGDPATMQQAPRYEDVVAEVQAFPRRRRIAACEIAGIERDRITIDPGFGFGKTAGAQFRACCASLPALAALGVPVRRRLVAQVDAGRDHRPAGRRAPGGEPRRRFARGAAWGDNTARA